jgi:ABC-2 type transport system permease protein
MNSVIKDIKKHIILWGLFIKNSLIGQLEYRVNFLTGIALELGYLLAKVTYLIVVYKAGVDINGLSPDEVLVFFGAYMIVTGTYAGLYMTNLFGISDHVRTGSLDLLIVKPASLQFLLTMRKSDLSCLIVDVSAGIAAVAAGLSRMSVEVDALSVLGFAGYTISGAIVGYALFLFPQLLAFWLTRTDAVSALVDSFWDFNNMPMGIYNRAVREIGVFLVPIFVVTNFPALFILKQLEPVYAVWGIASPFIFFFITRAFFKFSVKRYESASS